tara:strand:- start:234 stop:401 length:168 start_codon:yes stop_codon:yes gene_type:complete
MIRLDAKRRDYEIPLGKAMSGKSSDGRIADCHTCTGVEKSLQWGYWKSMRLCDER